MSGVCVGCGWTADYTTTSTCQCGHESTRHLCIMCATTVTYATGTTPATCVPCTVNPCTNQPCTTTWTNTPIHHEPLRLFDRVMHFLGARP